ncbi:MAG: hypothetical protein R6V14_07635 [Halanaerobiales bacterium]
MIDIKKQNGAALVLVILLLLVGTLLINALFITVRSYIKTMPHEEAMSKAFYSADSGVEFFKSNMSKINFNSIDNGDYLVVEDSDDNGELEFSFTDTKYWIESDILEVDDIRFNISVDSTSGKPTFVSEGNYESTNGRQYSEKIKFDISAGSGLKSFNIQDQNKNKHFNQAGQDVLSDIVNIYDWEANNFIKFAQIFLSNSFFDGDDFADDDTVDLYYENNDVEFKNDIINGENIIVKRGNLKMSKTTITDSIIVVDGNLSINPSKNYIKNSVIIVKDYVNASGISSSESFENSMFFIYSDDTNKKDYYLDFRGTGNIEIIPEDVKLELVNIPDGYQPKFSVNGWEQL